MTASEPTRPQTLIAMRDILGALKRMAHAEKHAMLACLLAMAEAECWAELYRGQK